MDPSNSANAIDSIGYLHNLFLDTFAFHVDFESIDNPGFFYDYSEDEREWEDLSTFLPYTDCDSMIQRIWDFGLEDDPEGYISELATVHSYSSYLESKLLELFSILDYTTEEVNVEDFIDSIKQKEYEFSLQNTSDSEFIVFYGTASILRWSCAYWDAVLEDENHPYYDILVDYLEDRDEYGGEGEILVRGFWKKIWRAISVIAVDALGFGAGFSFGTSLSGANVATGIAAGTLLGTAASAEMRNIWD